MILTADLLVSHLLVIRYAQVFNEAAFKIEAIGNAFFERHKLPHTIQSLTGKVVPDYREQGDRAAVKLLMMLKESDSMFEDVFDLEAKPFFDKFLNRKDELEKIVINVDEMTFTQVQELAKEAIQFYNMRHYYCIPRRDVMKVIPEELHEEYDEVATRMNGKRMTGTARGAIVMLNESFGIDK